MLCRFLSACVAFLLAACGQGGLPGTAPSRTDPFLAEAGFTAPIPIEIDTNRFAVFGNGYSLDAIQDSRNVHAIAFLTTNGAVSVVPMPEGPPYWKLQTSEGQTITGRRTFAFGTRRITGRSEARSWNEDSVSFYGETITYAVDVSDHLSQVQQRGLGPFTARIIIADNPRVGLWALQDIEYNDGGADVRAAQEIITAQGRAARDEFRQKAAQAMNASFDTIAQRLAESGRIASDHGNVLFSSANNVALVFLGEVHQSSIRELVERCATLNIEGYSNWRVADRSHMQRFVNDGWMIDVPDNRYWGRYRGVFFINPYVTGATSGAGGHFTSLAPRVYGPNIGHYQINTNGTLAPIQSFGTSYGPHRYYSSAELYGARTDFRGKQLVCTTAVE